MMFELLQNAFEAPPRLQRFRFLQCLFQGRFCSRTECGKLALGGLAAGKWTTRF